MDLQQQLFQALKFGGGLHFLTTFLLDRWRKNNNLKPHPVTGRLAYPKSTSDEATGWPGSTHTTPAGLAYTLYSLDSSLGADAALSVAAALLTSSSAAAGTATPSAAALAGGSGVAAPLAAGLAGYLVGQTFA
jgi:hypothetical protein